MIAAAFAALLLCACVKQQSGDGLLSVVLEWKLDAEIEEIPAVKSVYEASDSWRVVISPDVFDGTYGELKGQTLSVNPGSHTVRAFNCTEEEALEGYGKPRYAAEKEVDVLPDQINPVSLVCTMTNAKVSLADFEGSDSDGTFASVFDLESTVVTIAGSADMSVRPLTLYDGSEYAGPAYFPAGNLIYVKVATRRKGADNAFEYVAGPFAAQEAVWVKLALIYDPSATSGGISFTYLDAVSDDWITLKPYVSGTLKEDE